MSDITYIGSTMISRNNNHEPIKILNTIHAVMELAIHQIESDEKTGSDRSIDRYNIAGYAHLILSLGKEAIYAKNTHYVYRCMETLSYLGCNSAKIQSYQSVVSCFEALVQLGRICARRTADVFGVVALSHYICTQRNLWDTF